MKQLKKTLLTLVALLAVTTGAWADELASSYSSNATLNNVTVSADMEVNIAAGVTVTINNGLTIAEGKTLTVTGPGTLVVTGAKGKRGGVDQNGGNGGVAISGNIIVQGGATVTATGGNGGNGGEGMTPGTGGTGGVAISGNIIVQHGATVTANGGNGGKGGDGDEAGGNGGNGGNAFAGTLTYKSGTVTANGGSGGSGGSAENNGSSGSAGKAFANEVDFTQTTGYSVMNGTSTIESVLNQRTVVISGGTDPASATTVPITWDATAKTATLTNGMPAGNVTVSVDYFPKATADGAVTAATDVKATTDAPLVTVDATQLTGAAKLMYYVSTNATAPAYDAEGWTDQVPTAEKFTEAGSVNVWYYPVGTDEGVGGATATYSDGDMNATALAVTLGAAPTYNVTFNTEGLDATEAAKWSADPNTGLTKGETVTVTYSGTRKVIGVKAEKKKGYEHSLTIAVDPSTNDPIATAPAMTIEFNTGETWTDVAARYDWLDTYMTYTVYYVGADGNVHDANGCVTPDKTIDPNGSYHWGM